MCIPIAGYLLLGLIISQILSYFDLKSGPVFPDHYNHGSTTVVGYTEKHRLNDTYREFVLPLAEQIEKTHPVKLTQYAAADGATSIYLVELFQESGIDSRILSTDLIMNLHIVHDATDIDLIGIFDDRGNLIQIKYKGRCYIAKAPAERVKHRVEQLNIFTDRTLYSKLSSRLTAQFKKAPKITFSRAVITDNPRISFSQRDIFAKDYKEDGDIITVLNLFQSFSPPTIKKAMVSLGKKMKEGAYIIAGKVSQYYGYNEVSVWQKRGKKLVKLRGNYMDELSELDISVNLQRFINVDDDIERGRIQHSDI